MEKDVFKVLDYTDDKGEDQELNFECNTPHILISGDQVEKVLALEKKMLMNLSDSNGKEINLVIIDDKNVLPEEFFSSIAFNFVSRITEEDAIRHLSGDPFVSFFDRYLFIYRNDEKTFTELNTSGKEHLKMLIYFFPVISENRDLFKALKDSIGGIDTGVHVIAGMDFILEKPSLLKGCDIRISFPSAKAVKDMKFFCKKKYELPKTGNVWFRNGKTEEVKPITLK